jgi:hypothetical protein
MSPPNSPGGSSVQVVVAAAVQPADQRALPVAADSLDAAHSVEVGQRSHAEAIRLAATRWQAWRLPYRLTGPLAAACESGDPTIYTVDRPLTHRHEEIDASR